MLIYDIIGESSVILLCRRPGSEANLRLGKDAESLQNALCGNHGTRRTAELRNAKKCLEK